MDLSGFCLFLLGIKKFGRDSKHIILLLDEPGLFLHAKAQGNFLQFLEKNMGSHHQLIYTTHSLFMVDSEHIGRVRVVENLSNEEGWYAVSEERRGTKVVGGYGVLKTRKDSLIPLQAALGYQIFSIFCLLVLIVWLLRELRI